MNTATCKFNHRLLDHLNTGYNAYMPALCWALRNGCEQRGDVMLHDRLHNPAELSFVYIIDYDNATVTVEVHRSGIEGAVISQTKALPCADGGPVVVKSVMTVAKRLETEQPESFKISAASSVVLAIESIIVDYMKEQIYRIQTRSPENAVWSDRYQLCYV